MRIVPTTPDPEVARIAERLTNPPAEDAARWERFEKVRDLVENCRDALGSLSEAQRQIVGLYISNAVRLGAGEDYEISPALYPPKPTLKVVR